MEYCFDDIIDIPKFVKLMETMFNDFSISYSIEDIEGNVHCKTGRQDLCTHYHNVCGKTAKRCEESKNYLRNHLHEKQYVSCTCLNGLVCCAAPITVEGRHMATIFLGQLLDRSPDNVFFLRQVRECGFDEHAYMEALRKVPVVSENHIKTIMTTCVQFVEILTLNGLERMNQLKVEKALNYRLALEELVINVSTRFININHDDIDDEIYSTLKTVGEFVGADRSYLKMLSHEEMHIGKAYEWHTDGIEPAVDLITGLPASIYKWSMDKTRHNRNFSIIRFCDIPDSAVNEKELWQKLGIQSLVSIPIILDKTLSGLLGFSTNNPSRKWLEEDIMLLEFVGNIIANVLSHKQMVDALRQSEERWRFALEGSGDAVWDWDMQSNKIMRTKSYIEMLGYEEHEISGNINEWINRVHPDDLKRANSVYHMHYDGKTAYASVEYRMQCKNGGYKWILDRGKVTSRAQDGRPLRIIGTLTDITERKQMEEALRESEERFRLMADSAPVMIWLSDENNILKYVSRRWLEFTGRTLKDEIGNGWTEVIHPDDLQLCLDTTYEGARNPKEFKIEYRLRRRDGEYRWILDVGIPIFAADNTLSGYIGSCIDITERKQMEEELKKAKDAAEFANNQKSSYLVNMSHEFRTPINVIFSALQVMEMAMKNSSPVDNRDKLKKYTGMIKQNCYRLIKLVNNLIDISKIDAGYIELKLKNCNIVSVVEEITLSVVEYVRQKRIELIFDSDVEEKLMACDAEKIERVMLNLISNAIKFTEPGGSLFVNLYDMNEKVMITVRDTGIGITKEKQSHIFERFVQVEELFTTRHEGSGIGLSIVKSFVELHGGKISVDSEYGKGSMFIIELPVKIIPERDGDKNRLLKQDSNIENLIIEFSDIYF